MKTMLLKCKSILNKETSADGYLWYIYIYHLSVGICTNVIESAGCNENKVIN